MIEVLGERLLDAVWVTNERSKWRVIVMRMPSVLPNADVKSLDTLPYKVLQQYAKYFNIRANIKASKLRKELAKHLDEILKITQTEDTMVPQPRKSSTASSERKSSNSYEDCFVTNSSNEIFMPLSMDGITFRESSVSPLVEISSPKSSAKFSSLTLVRRSTPSNSCVAAKDTSPILGEKSPVLSENRHSIEAVGSEPNRSIDKKLNETYDIDDTEESMKENCPPANDFVPAQPQNCSSAHIRVEETEDAFLIFEETEDYNFPFSDKSSPVIELPLPPRKSRSKVKSTPLRKICSNGTSESHTKKLSGAITKPKNSSSSIIRSRTPNFAKIHQRAFDKMETLAEFDKRRKVSSMRSQSSENIHKNRISYCHTGKEIPRKSENNPSGINKSQQHTSARTSSSNKSQHTIARTSSSNKSLHTVARTSSVEKVGSSKSKFNLEASLKAKPTWKMHRGPIRPLFPAHQN